MATCPKCNGEMENGRLSGVVKWAPVPSNASLVARLGSALKHIRVDGMRCTQCGFLELYARPATVAAGLSVKAVVTGSQGDSIAAIAASSRASG